jgi:tRNA pseudouridine38-40 synthase
MPTFKLTIEYDGSAYHGWQRQKSEPTLQAAIEEALARILRRPVVLVGSGRTDAGVHALGQTAHFRVDTALGPEIFPKALNSLLPADIVVRGCQIAAEGFHARYDARAKHYRYRILNRPLPAAIGRQYVWHLRRPLDREAMNRAAAALCGTHDFKAFEGAGSPRATTVRTIQRALWTPGDGDELRFDIQGSGFLRFMVRNIVGTLVEIGTGKRPPETLAALLAGQDRRRAGATAPAGGLCLVAVFY